MEWFLTCPDGAGSMRRSDATDSDYDWGSTALRSEKTSGRGKAISINGSAPGSPRGVNL